MPEADLCENTLIWIILIGLFVDDVLPAQRDSCEHIMNSPLEYNKTIYIHMTLGGPRILLPEICVFGRFLLKFPIFVNLALDKTYFWESLASYTLLAKKVVTPPLKTIKPMWIELLCFHLAEIGMIWTRDCSPTKSDTTLGRHSMQVQVGSSSSETTV